MPQTFKALSTEDAQEVGWIVVPTTRTVSIFTPDEKFVTYADGKFTDAATGITLDIDEVFEGFG